MTSTPSNPEEHQRDGLPAWSSWIELNSSQKCFDALNYFKASSDDLQELVRGQIGSHNRRVRQLVPPLQEQIDMVASDSEYVFESYVFGGTEPSETLSVVRVRDMINLMAADVKDRRKFLASLLVDDRIEFDISIEKFKDSIWSLYKDKITSSDLVSDFGVLYQEVLTDDIAIILESIGVEPSHKLKQLRGISRIALGYFGIG